jgi:hypothetical protein
MAAVLCAWNDGSMYDDPDPVEPPGTERRTIWAFFTNPGAPFSEAFQRMVLASTTDFAVELCGPTPEAVHMAARWSAHDLVVVQGRMIERCEAALAAAGRKRFGVVSNFGQEAVEAYGLAPGTPVFPTRDIGNEDAIRVFIDGLLRYSRSGGSGGPN